MLVLLSLLGCPPPSSDSEKPDPASDTATDGCGPSEWHVDADGDGIGSAETVDACATGALVESGDDCDDADATIFPGAAEVCDGVDQDCDGVADDGLATFDAAPDVDADGYGDAVLVATGCAIPDGWITGDLTDCDDADATVNPAALEVCNGIDDDCDALVDDDDSPLYGAPDWYRDEDGDAWGLEDEHLTGCVAPDGYTAAYGDCDDTDATIHPEAEEICLDVIDQDCDGYTDDYTDVCAPSGEEGVGELCDTSVVPVDSALCAEGVAAVLGSGAAYDTVQGAIDAAAAGEVVTVCPGTWAEPLDINSDVSLAGYGVGTSILANPTGNLSLGSGVVVTLADLSFEDGDRGYGGAIQGSDATLCITRSSFVGNSAENGGAIYLYGTGALSIDDSTFDSNVASYSGGGLYLSDGYTLAVEGSSFLNNYSGYEAGGAEVSGNVTGSMTDTVFEGNEADYEGGGLEYAAGRGLGATLTLLAVTFEGNSAGYEGGGISMGSWDFPTIICIECTFVDNFSETGGAIAEGSWGGEDFRAILTTFTGNSASSGAGAISMGGWGTSFVETEGTTFDANLAPYGAAIYANGRGVETAMLIESTVINNDSYAVVFGADATLTSIDTDWGSGADDNVPVDVNGSYTYGAGANFTCAASICY